MKTLLLLALLMSSTSYAAISFDNVECYADMSDGDCKIDESGSTFKVECFITVDLTYKNGEKVQAVLEGKSTVNKNKYAVMTNNLVKERAVMEANGKLYEQLSPFYNMKSCQ